MYILSKDKPQILILFIITISFIAISFSPVAAQTQTQADKTYIKVQVDGLACPFCAYGLEKKLKQVDKAQDIQINVKEGYATLDVPQKTEDMEAELRKVVEDAGFTAREIVFSAKPFEESDDH